MEYVTEFVNTIVDLDRRKVISLKWMTIWVLSLVSTMTAILYGWNYFFEGSVDDHFPKSIKDLNNQNYIFHNAAESRRHFLKEVNIVIFSCLDDFTQNKDRNISIINEVQNTMRTIKSAALFSKLVIHFHIYSTDDVFQSLVNEVSKWTYKILHRISFQFHPAWNPESIVKQNFDISSLKHIQWKSCDFSYVFLPTFSKGIEPVLYVKTGSIFITSVDRVWQNMLEYRDSNVISLPFLTKEPMCFSTDSYSNLDNTFGTSIVLFDIFRLQEASFVVPVAKNAFNQTLLPINVGQYQTTTMAWDINMIVTIFNLFQSVIRKPDVDILNILAIFNSDKFNQLPCSWNFNLELCEGRHMHCDTANLLINSHKSTYTDYVYKNIAEKIDGVNYEFNLTRFQYFLKHQTKELHTFPLPYNHCLYYNWKAITNTID